MISLSDIHKANILIVDDQEANVLLLEEMLREAGYLAIASTRDPREVCELHRRNRYALIVLDLQMPGLDGFQVLAGLKAIETEGYLSVLVQTAEPDHKLRALKAGAKDFVSQPFDLAEVLVRVHNLLEVRLLNREAQVRTDMAEARFVEAQKMKVIGQLASGVAHDFNNIIAIIMGYSDLMMHDHELGVTDHLREQASEIRQASQRAAALTRQLLEFSRKQTVQLSLLDLNDVVRDLDKMLHRLIDEDITLTLVPGKHMGQIKADAGQLGQVIMNLVVNARDAMPDGGRLTITTGNVTLDENHAGTHAGLIPGDYVMLRVADTGTGMTDEVKRHLFDAFFTTKPTGKGTGLGLATCQTIVQRSGGHIQVSSELGVGSTFEVFFPRVEQFSEIKPTELELAPRGTETLLVGEAGSRLGGRSHP